MTCNQCGFDSPIASNYCEGCGIPLTDQPHLPPSVKLSADKSEDAQLNSAPISQSDQGLKASKRRTPKAQKTKILTTLLVVGLIIFSMTFTFLKISQMDNQMKNLSKRLGSQDLVSTVTDLNSSVNDLSTQVIVLKINLRDANSRISNLQTCVNNFEKAFVEYTFHRPGSFTGC